MPKFSVEMTVVRTIIESKRVQLEIEAEDQDEAEEKASLAAERSQYHDIEEKDWDLDEISSEGQDLEVTAPESDEDE